MKRILLALLLTVFVGCNVAFAQAGPGTLTLAWANNDAAYGPLCTSPATTEPCLTATEAEDITSLTPIVLSGTISATATSFVYTYATAPSWGNHTYAIIANGIGATGTATQSAPATVVVDIEPKLNAPTITSAVAK